MSSSYEEVYADWQKDPEAWWAKAAEDVRWTKKWDHVLSNPRENFYNWFEGAELNTCFNAVDRHVEEGRADQLALIYDSPITGKQRKFTYVELQKKVAKFAGVLRGLGVEKGDRVIIYMPMVPQAVIAILATSRIGAVHSVVFGGFAANELAPALTTPHPKSSCLAAVVSNPVVSSNINPCWMLPLIPRSTSRTPV